MGNEIKNKEEKKTKKKHGKLYFFLIVLIGAGIVVGYMIHTGSWNPYKETAISEEAKISYENQVEDARAFVNATPLGNDNGLEEIENDPDGYYNPQTGVSPYGFRVKDYGPDGENGVLMTKQATDENYFYTFGGYLFIDYMKNFDYANEKYMKEFNGHSKSISQDIDEKTKTFLSWKDNGYDIYILQNCKVYYLNMLEPEYYQNVQNLYNFLNINYQIPNFEELEKLK